MTKPCYKKLATLALFFTISAFIVMALTTVQSYSGTDDGQGSTVANLLIFFAVLLLSLLAFFTTSVTNEDAATDSEARIQPQAPSKTHRL